MYIISWITWNRINYNYLSNYWIYVFPSTHEIRNGFRTFTIKLQSIQCGTSSRSW
uniref:Uncharacterized protein n=1 Tax=Rhizophora mucronata TaxID=61149 RepID=A0A2P2PM45_RHIMU